MSQYFRSAALCDRAVAATSPISLDGDAAAAARSEGESGDDATALAASKVAQRATTFEERVAATCLSGVRRLRAQLDHEHGAQFQLQRERDVRVMCREARRQQRLEQRLAVEAARNEALLAHLKQERAQCKPPHHRQQQEQEQEKEKEPAQPGAAVQAENAAEALRSIGPVGARSAQTQIAMFERLRLEEERRMRHENAAQGSVIGLYNNIALSAAMTNESGSDRGGQAATALPPPPPPPFPSMLASGRAPADLVPIGFLPADVVARALREGAGRARADDVRRRLTEHNGRVRAQFDEFRSLERVAAAEHAAHQARVARERTLMLAEVVAQDQARQRERAEDTAAALRLLHPGTFVDHFSCGSCDGTSALIHGAVVSAPSAGLLVEARGISKARAAAATADPRRLLPELPVRVHPIDVYQRLVREDLLLDREQDADEQRQRVLGKM